MTELYFYLLYYFSGYIVCSTILTLFFYVTIMKWKKRGIVVQNASWGRKLFGFTGVLLDIIYNYTTLTLVLAQFPRRGETLATSRLSRTFKQSGWRGLIAKAFCKLLNVWDKGHCR